MKKLKGKCKTCLGCSLLEDYAFKGRKYCKYYIDSREKNYRIILWLVAEMTVLGILAYIIYLKISKLAGG